LAQEKLHEFINKKNEKQLNLNLIRA